MERGEDSFVSKRQGFAEVASWDPGECVPVTGELVQLPHSRHGNAGTFSVLPESSPQNKTP